MSTLIIAEKPSVGRTLAKFLNAETRTDGYIYNSTYTVSWAIGHLVELAPPKAYTPDPWNLSSLPIIPSTFQLQAKSTTRKQLTILKNLIAKADTIINATDAGREGELIFRYILEMSKPKTSDIKRLWVSSYTPNDLKKAFQELKPQSSYDGLYFAGKARSETDWIYGMNATIGYTLKLMASKPKSLGRVQTPTVCMITKRYKEHKDFVKQKTFTPTIHLTKDGIEFIAKAKDYTLNRAEAEKIINSVNTDATTILATRESSKQSPPALFDLTSLQIDCNKRLSLTADKTLQLAQELYEKDKLITYPRTDSSYLNQTQKPGIVSLLYHLKSDYPSRSKHLEKKLRTISFNDSKVTDHHAIIPTLERATLPDGDKKNVFDIIVNRTLAHFSKDAEKVSVNYTFESNKQLFFTKEVFYDKLHWRELLFTTNQTATKIPIVQLSEVLSIDNKTVEEGSTQAPPLLTEASLLSLMKNCGKEFDDDILPSIKKDGIGTPATRSSIIERIIKVGYVKRDKKYLIPTEMGLKLYPEIQNFDLADIALTGRIEKGLYNIQDNKITYDDYMNYLKDEIFSKTMKQILSVSPKAEDNNLYNCPKCQQKKTQIFSQCTKCSNCDLSISKSFFSKTLTNQQMKIILAGETISLEKLKGKSKKPFNAKAKWDSEENRISLVFEARERKETNYTCPKCESKLVEHDSFYGCSSYKDGCKFSIPKIKGGHTFRESDLNTLLRGEVLKDIEFTSFKKKTKYTASLSIIDGKLIQSFS